MQDRKERKVHAFKMSHEKIFKDSLPIAQWKADLLHMRCQDSCFTEHPLGKGVPDSFPSL